MLIMKDKIFLFVAVCLAAIAASAQRTSLNQGWEFQKLSTARGGEIKNQGSDWSSQYNIEHVATGSRTAVHPDSVKAELVRLDGGAWESVSLPHTPSVEPLTVVHQWQGVCYYRRTLSVDPALTGKRLWLEFEGAMHQADVWLNGAHIAAHTGGYLPFVVDVTDRVKPGTGNELLVRLDNRNNPLIPPGKPLESLDFCYFSGLYRDVSLIAKPRMHVTHPAVADRVAGGGVFVTYPEVSAQRAVVDVKVQVANEDLRAGNLQLRAALYEWVPGKGRGRKTVAGTGEVQAVPAGATADFHQTLQVKAPRLWSPDAPRLYELVTEIVEGDKVIDSETTRIGIRRIAFSRERGFVINGTPVELVGTNRHQEYPYVGNAISDRAQYRDIYQIKANGFNIVRLGHYPQDPSVLDACDELGVLAIEPIPGWQFYNGNPAFVEHTYNDVRQMIRRDRNHPSVVLWETTLNESNPPAHWKDRAVAVAHEEYPGDQCYTSGDSYGYEGFDVCYNDWADGFQRPNRTKKAGFIREYYDYEFGGHYSTTRVGRGWGHAALMQNAWNAQWSFNRYKADYPATSGAAVWSMYDYNRGCCDNICLSGVADLFRLPKYSLPFFRSQQSAGTALPGGPMPYEVFIAAAYDGVRRIDTLQVYGNVDEVELLHDGVTLGRRRPDNGPTTSHYAGKPDGGNGGNLKHPPFTFTGVDWHSGVLEAVGYKDGKPVARHTVAVPGEAARLDISYFESGKPAASHDLLIVYVALKDKKGHPLTHVNGRKIRLNVAQGGRVQGPAETATEMGVASFLVRTDDARRLRLTAESDGLTARYTVRLE